MGGCLGCRAVGLCAVERDISDILPPVLSDVSPDVSSISPVTSSSNHSASPTIITCSDGISTLSCHPVSEN